MLLSFEGEARLNWHFVPIERKGVSLKELSSSQREPAQALLGLGLGANGYEKAATIISLEEVLRRIEQGQGPVRDPELYYFSVFGEPDGTKPWGWSCEGHHLSLNYTIVGGRVANTPLFLGSNPGEVLHGPRKGVSPLAAEERIARELLMSLDSSQRAQAVVSASAPDDILSGNSRKAAPLSPAGVSAGLLTGQQSAILMRLIEEYLSNMPEAIALRRMRNLRAGHFGEIYFAWAGAFERFQPHYYRLQGPGFLVEYDNTQNNANHVHTVWRDLDGDFGEDLLARHHRESHRP